MQKTLIAMAVGATIAAAPLVAAQADVKLRGKLQVDLVSLDGGKFDSEVQQGDAGGRSRVFIDASKDLGNGMKAFGRYAWKTNPSNGSQISARDQWVGLKGSFGMVKFGRQATPYKMNGGVKWDPYAASFLEARRSGGMSGDSKGHNGFENDVILYGSPKFAGIKFQLGYIADENATGGGTKPSQRGTFLFGGTGVWGPVSGIAGYQNFKQRAVGAVAGKDDVKQVKLGVRYKANGLIAAFQWEDVDSIGSIRVNGHKVTPKGQKGGKIIFLNLGYKFGNTLIAGNYGKTDADGSGQDVDYGAIGVTYFFAKKVRAVLGYAVTETDTKYKMFGTYLRYDF
ncbi:MAG: trimeric porin PorB [Gammaproteobacteria bacterium]|nr:MAG: trimeric porin PorB [Gammaproteobacteria bacterium]